MSDAILEEVGQHFVMKLLLLVEIDVGCLVVAGGCITPESAVSSLPSFLTRGFCFLSVVLPLGEVTIAAAKRSTFKLFEAS